ncbi:MAG: L-glutamate gamma-semialdehyde dehydrogenase [Saprospiraceae bacterium]
MSNAFFQIPPPVNEPVLEYRASSKEREEVKAAIAVMKQKPIDIPMIIGGKKVKSDEKVAISPPHEHSHVLGHYYKGTGKDVEKAISAARKASEQWANMAWQDRAAIFLKAAELMAGPYRARMNAATMLGQSKSVYQAEIDCVCELVDFLRFNVQYMTDIYAQQPGNSKGIWNRMEYRPLEGFVFALTPFNFTAIAGNLCAAPAMMGNVVVWKPAGTQIFSAHLIMQIYQEAGLPDGVINMVFADGKSTGEAVFNSPDFAGLHFTGSTSVFQSMWKKIGENIAKYKSYPRIVGETGGKDFVMVHPSAPAQQVVTALVRGAFEYQGQKCSAASRAYIPESLWAEVKAGMERDMASFKMGTTEDFSNFINAVIDEKAFDKIAGYIDNARKAKKSKVIIGGKYDKSKGYFIEPTVIESSDPYSVTMCEEIFGPVLSVYVYKDNDFEKTLDIVDKTSPYALTGSIISKDRAAIAIATDKLRYAAGNFYINDKPTGAVVNQQPFGGARASGTNDKAGSLLNLYRWVSARSIKETLVPPVDYRYPFLES